MSLAAHPGFSKTDLQKNMDKDTLASLELMTAKEGAQPTIAACLREDVKGGQYWGPDGPNEQKGKPAFVKDEKVLEKRVQKLSHQELHINFYIVNNLEGMPVNSSL